MASTTPEALSNAGEHVSSGASLKSLVAIVMVVATIFVGFFDSTQFVTFWQGPVLYSGVEFTTRGADPIIAHVTDPRLVRQGVHAGQAVTWQGRSKWRAAFPLPGDTVDVQTPSGAITLRAAHQPVDVTLATILTVALLVALTLLVFAGIFCYRRPGVMSASLWVLLAANFNISWLIVTFSQLPEIAARPIVTFILVIYGAWAYYPLVWFALRFPDDRLRGRGMRIADYIWTAISLTALVWFTFDQSQQTFATSGLDGQTANNLWRYTVPQNVPLAAATVAFLWVYVRGGYAARQRTLWAIVGFLLMIVLSVIGNFATEGSDDSWVLFGNICLALSSFCPLAMVYAVLRHHLLDISFVVNRALVYSILTAVIVLAVGLVDWVAGKYLFETKAALAVEATIIIGLGFVLQRLHRVLERLVDRVIFAARHSAERHVERVIAGLAFARSYDAVLQAVVYEPHAALDLVSCAVFMDNGNALALRAHIGWRSAADTTIARDDALARLLLAERIPVDIAQAHWHSSIAGLHDASLDVAIPLFSRNDLLGIALYGRHRNGSTIDPEERALLRRLCDAGAVAYEAVALEQARAELAVIRSTKAITPANVL